MREAHLQWCIKHGCNTVLLCLNNEECMSLFRNGYMKTWDMAKVNMTLNYIKRIKSLGGLVAIALYDGPAIPGAKYHPIIDCPDEMHAQFIQIVCQALNPYVDLWVLGCETNRYWSIDKVETAIGFIKQCSPFRFVGTHEQNVGKRNGKWKLLRRVPINADFHCYETSNHPDQGDSRSVADMEAEVKFLCSTTNIPVWVGEHNLNQWGAKGRAQSRAFAKINGVYGTPGPT